MTSNPSPKNVDSIVLVRQISTNSSSRNEFPKKEELFEDEEKKNKILEFEYAKSSRASKVLKTLGLPNLETESVDSHVIIQSNEESYWNGFYAIPTITFGVASTFVFTLIPYHNQMESPSHWYELAMLMPLLPVLFTFDAILQCYYCFEATHMLSLLSFFRVYIPAALMNVIPYCLSLMIWTLVLGNNPPVPLAQVTAFLGIIGFVTALAVGIRSQNKKLGDGKRLFWFLLTFAYQGPILFATYSGNRILLENLPENFQWILAITLPALREFHIIVLTKMLSKAKPCSQEIILFQMDLALQIFHNFYVALFLASVNDVTVYSILGAEFLLHLRSCYGIIRINKRMVATDTSDDEERKRELREAVSGLVLGESIEIFVPFCYLITWLSAYYGPNASIMGNVQNNYWDFVAVEDAGVVVLVTMKMFVIDLGIALITGLILWIFCRINFLKEFCKLMKTYWSWIAIRLAALLFRVSTELDLFIFFI